MRYNIRIGGAKLHPHAVISFALPRRYPSLTVKLFDPTPSHEWGHEGLSFVNLDQLIRPISMDGLRWALRSMVKPAVKPSIAPFDVRAMLRGLPQPTPKKVSSDRHREYKRSPSKWLGVVVDDLAAGAEPSKLPTVNAVEDFVQRVNDRINGVLPRRRRYPVGFNPLPDVNKFPKLPWRERNNLHD